MPSDRIDLFVLGAGTPHTGEVPSALVRAGSAPTLSWIISATAGAVEDTHFIGGYHFEEVAAQFTELKYSRNDEWETTRSAATLLQSPLVAGTAALSCYSDILFRSEVVDALVASPAPVTVAIDSRWRERYAGRTEADLAASEKVVARDGRVLALGQGLSADVANAEFVGLVLLRPEAVDLLLDAREALGETLRTANVSGLVEWLRLSGVEVASVDVDGNWAEVNAPQDLARFVMGTKAETLARLRAQVTEAVIQDQISFVFGEWSTARATCVTRVRERFGSDPLVVRSSSNREDGFDAASAGVYDSILDVDPVEGLEAAIDAVFTSYGDPTPEEQVLVQPFIASVAMHGVIFTRTLDRGAPYYVLNYDESGDTEAITAGTSTGSQTLIVQRDADPRTALEPPFRGIMLAVKELESLLDYDALDVEFALDSSGQTHIFQVRPIAVGWDESQMTDAACAAALDEARQAWARLSPCPPFLPGGPAVFGVMPDWNPAEIIGTAPHALSASIYELLITDEVWAAQRAEYGYRDVRPQPLLARFAGRPYVDVRASFSSFMPAEIPDELAGRLVTFYLEWLKANPHLHDKVEFDVVPTCMSLDFERWRTRLADHGGFADAEIDAVADGLRRITAGAFSRVDDDLARIEAVQQRYEQVRTAEGLSHIDRARILLDDARRLGTLPFAHLARSGFVAMTLMRSAVATGVIGADAMASFMSSLNTVTREFSRDVAAARTGDCSLEALIERYGHLRPGTYDITSPSYAADVDGYLTPLIQASANAEAEEPDDGAWARDRDALFAALATVGLPSDPNVVEPFLRGATAGRELAKFHFTRNLSAALESLAAFGAEHGLSRAEVADLPIDALFSAGQNRPGFDPDRLRELAELGRNAQQVCAACPMPALLTTEEDFAAFWLMTTQPNFIGTRRVRAGVAWLDHPITGDDPLAGKIVVIPQADPGYDWLFGQDIAALVTMYGGANSHMAIRSAEFRLPAAIGVGERIYDDLRKARIVDLDPANQRIEVIA